MVSNGTDCKVRSQFTETAVTWRPATALPGALTWYPLKASLYQEAAKNLQTGGENKKYFSSPAASSAEFALFLLGPALEKVTAGLSENEQWSAASASSLSVTA